MVNQDNNNLGDLLQLGEKVQDIIEKAVTSQNYQKLNQTITQAVNKTVWQYQESLRKANEKAAPPKKELPAVYAQLGGDRIKSILKIVFGGVITGGMAVGILSVSIMSLIFGGGGSVPVLMMLAGAAAGGGLLGSGCKGLGRLSRFKKYVNVLGDRTYGSFDLLSRAVKKPVKFVKKDIKAMISRGWFLEGHVDSQETCLITSNDTYHQYQLTEKQMEEKKAETKAKEAAEAKAKSRMSPEVQEVLNKGDEYLREIRACNDAIPGMEISEKISRIEQVVEHIFQRAEEHPEIIPDLKRMMDYYLPMTVKLLNAYEDMDRQPVQGENIRNSKKEIENTLDTLSAAFEKLLDSVFQDTAWDVSSDISVLKTLLAQEGLSGNDFAETRKQPVNK